MNSIWTTLQYVRCWTTAAVMVVVGGPLAGCAVNNLGLIAAHTTDAEGVSVVSAHVLGVHLRTTAEDRGLSLGYTRRTRIVPVGAGSTAGFTGWRIGVAPLSQVPAIALNTSTLGLETRVMAVDGSFTLGAIDSIRLAQVSAGESVDFSLSYDAIHPAQSIYINCMESEAC